MPWIRLQNVKKDGDGRIISGTATIVDTEYVQGKKHHSKQVTREKLGKPLFIADDKRSGIFVSFEKGIVSYDADTDELNTLEMDDPRLEGLIESIGLDVHTIFGDGYLFLNYLKNMGMMGLLKEIFSEKTDLHRCVAHLYHNQMRNGSRDRCDHFLRKSFVSHAVPDVVNTGLAVDTRFFDMMGKDELRLSFFKAYVDFRRASNPEFGRCCYIDSTPLPNDIDDNPFNAFSSHGESGIQCRLVLVADIGTGEPVWFKIIPGNVLDVNTLKSITDEVHLDLGVEICEYILDAGYANKELITGYSLGEAERTVVRTTAKGEKVESVVIKEDGKLAEAEPPSKTMVVKMPKRNGYGHMDMFDSVKDLLNNGKYDFKRENHSYFGKRREVCLFGRRIYAYIYVDHQNALSGYNDYMRDHEREFEGLKDKEKTWRKYASGFFVLLSNRRESPKEILDLYFGRCYIETIFKTAKEYLQMLPLKKWNSTRIYGKMLTDMISTIIYLNMRKDLASTDLALTEVPTITQSLMCALGKDGMVRVDPPNAQVKKVYRTFGIDLPNQFPLGEFVDGCML